MKDNIDYFLDNHGEEFEIAMFAGDDYRDGSGNFTVDAYRGVPVFRMALPPGQNAFWQPHSSLAASYFGRILESFQPDLVHIHCLQRLTASIAESCQTRGVPYFVTLHDAWWLSDFPFLANEDGLAAPAHIDYHHQPRKPQFGTLASILRAERVRRALLGAHRRFAVSNSFAELYRGCGIPCDVVENGNPKIESRPRSISSGPVQICHLGGQERHKGAFLVEAALRNNAFGNIEFTMVDLTRDGSATSHSMWGNTPVHVIGKMDTEELSNFYAGMHVLVAPSTCHESFGLVAREALSHGLWVIASERGAMSEPVREGVNGHTVDVSNAEELSQVFAAINSDPDRYRVSPVGVPPQRHVDDQSRELVDLYRRTFD
jgi:glycosyltransferase involved in cell wall biosynthesis